MCFLLFIASPLTLSEIRSMLPPGLSADLAASSEQAVLRGLFPATRTAARLLSGACSCDLVLDRADSRGEERQLRNRHLEAGRSRDAVIAALESHRRRGTGFGSLAAARAALADFVAEHARNAGPTLYLLRFAPERLDRGLPGTVTRLTRGAVLADVEGWLVEDRPTLVAP